MKKFFILAGLFVFFSNCAWAEYFWWTGGDSTTNLHDWFAPGNWYISQDPGGSSPGASNLQPGVNDHMIVRSASNGDPDNYPILPAGASNVECSSLTIETDGRLDIAGRTLAVTNGVTQTGGRLDAAGGAIIAGNNIALPSVVNAVQNITFATTMAGASISLTNSGGTLNIAVLSNTILSGVTIPPRTGPVTIVETGAIAVASGGITTTTGAVSLEAGAGITQAGLIAAASLSIQAGGTVLLDQANTAAVLAANQTAGDFTFYNAGNLEVGTVGALSGIASTGKVEVAVIGSSPAPELKTTATINSPDITLSADVMDIQGDLNAGTGKVTIRNINNGTAIFVGGSGIGLEISSGINITADRLEIGRANADASGQITITTMPTITGSLNTLVLRTGAGISGSIPLNITNLAIQSGLDIDLSGFTVTNIAADATITTGGNSGGHVSLAAASGFFIANIEGVDGLKCRPGEYIALNASGAVGQTAPVNAGAAGSLLLQGAGPFTLMNTANEIGVLAASSGGPGDGPLAYTDVNTFEVGTVTTAPPLPVTVDGINRTGAVGLTAAGITQSATGPISSDGLRLTLSSGGTPITLMHASNSVGTLAVSSSAGNISFRNNAPLIIGSVTVPTGSLPVTGITTTGTVSLTVSGGLNQSGSPNPGIITADTLNLLTANTVNLPEANMVNNLTAGPFGVGGINLTFTNAGPLDIGDGINGINTGTGSVTLNVTGSVTQDRPITSAGLTVTASAGIALPLGNAAGTVHLANTGGNPGNIAYTNAGTFTADAVNSAAGSTSTGKIDITGTAGTLSLGDLGGGNAGVGLKSNNGNITVSADTMNIGTGINAGTAKAAIRNETTKTITLGGSTPSSDIFISSAMLAYVTAGSLEIGRTELGQETGTITVQAIPVISNCDTLILRTGANVTPLAGGQLPIKNLAVEAAGDVVLNFTTVNETIAVDTTAASSGGNITLNSAGGFMIAAIGTSVGIPGLDGLQCPDGQTITLNAGAVIQNAPVTAGATGKLLLLGAGPYTLTGSGNEIGTLAGNVTGAVSYTDATGIEIGSVAATTGLTTTNSPAALTAASGSIAITQPIAAGSGVVTLGATTGISETAAGTITTTGGLVIQGAYANGSTIDLNQANSVSTLTVSADGSAAGLAVNADVNFTNSLSTGDLLVHRINAAGRAVALTAASGGITQTGAAGVITANTLMLSGPSGGPPGPPSQTFNLNAGDTSQTGVAVASSNQVNTLAARGKVNLVFYNRNALVIGPASGVNGIDTRAGASISADDGSVILNVNGAVTQTQPISTGNQLAGLIVKATAGIDLGGANDLVEAHLYNNSTALTNITFHNAGSGISAGPPPTNMVWVDALNEFLGGTIDVSTAGGILSLGDLVSWNSTDLAVLPSVPYPGVGLKSNSSDITFTGDSLEILRGINTSGGAGSKKVTIRNASATKTIQVGGSFNTSSSDIFLDGNSPGALERITASLLEVGRSDAAASGEITVDSGAAGNFDTLILRTGAGITPSGGGGISVTNLVIDANDAVIIDVSGNNNVAVKSQTGEIKLSSTASGGFHIFTYVDAVNGTIAGLECAAPNQLIELTAAGPVTQEAGSLAVPGGAPVNAGPTGTLSLNGTGSYTLDARAYPAMTAPVNYTGTLIAGTGTASTSPASIVYTDNGSFTAGNASTAITTNGGNVTLTYGTAAGSTIGLANNITSSGTANGGDITLNGAVVLNAGVTVSTGTGTGNVAFTGTVNGGYALDVTAGTGIVTFSGPVGAGTALASLAVTGGRVQIPGVLSPSQRSIRAVGNITFGDTTPLNIPNTPVEFIAGTGEYVVIETTSTSPLPSPGHVTFCDTAGVPITAAPLPPGALYGIGVRRNLIITTGTGEVSFYGNVQAGYNNPATPPAPGTIAGHALYIDAARLILGPSVDMDTWINGANNYGHVYMKVDGLNFVNNLSNNLNTAGSVGGSTGGVVHLTTRTAGTNIEYCTIRTDLSHDPDTHRNYFGTAEYFSSEWNSVTARAYTLGDVTHTGDIYITGVNMTRIALTIENSGLIRVEPRSSSIPDYSSYYATGYDGYTSNSQPLTLVTHGGGTIEMMGDTEINLGGAAFGLAAKVVLKDVTLGSPTRARITANGGIALMVNGSVGSIDGDGTPGNNSLELHSAGTIILGMPIGADSIATRLGNITVDSPDIRILPPNGGLVSIFSAGGSGAVKFMGPVSSVKTSADQTLLSGLFVTDYSGFTGDNVGLSVTAAGTISFGKVIPGPLIHGSVSVSGAISLTGQVRGLDSAGEPTSALADIETNLTLAAAGGVAGSMGGTVTFESGSDVTVKQLTVNGITVNNGTITAGDVSYSGDPLGFDPAVNYAARFNNGYSGSGSLVNADPNKYVVFRGNTVLGSAAPAAGWLVFLGNGNQTFNSSGKDIPNVLVFHTDNTTGVELTGNPVVQRGGRLVIKSGFLNLAALAWDMLGTLGSSLTSAGFDGVEGTLTMMNGTSLLAGGSGGFATSGSNFILDAEPVTSTGAESDINRLSKIITSGDITVASGTQGTFEHTELKIQGGGPAAADLQFNASPFVVGALTVDTVNFKTVNLNNDLDVKYNVTIINDGFLDPGFNRTITVGRNWIQDYSNARFNYSNSVVKFTGANALTEDPDDPSNNPVNLYIRVTGQTAWNDFICETPGLTIRFSVSNDPARFHRFTGLFKVHGTEAQRVSLSRDAWPWNLPWDSPWPNPAPYNPTNPVDRSDYLGKCWFMQIESDTDIQLQYADVYYCRSLQVIPIPINVRAEPFNRHFTINWMNKKALIYSFAEDTDGNGRIDRIRVQSSVPVGNDFSGVGASVRSRALIGRPGEAYAVDTSKGTGGFARGAGAANRDAFYIYLVEKDYADGDAVLEWTFYNSTLISERGNFLLDTEYDPMLTIDTVPPRIAHTLALPGRAEFFIQLTEPTETLAGGKTLQFDFVPPFQADSSNGTPVSFRSTYWIEWLVPLSSGSLTVGNLADGTVTFKLSGRDLAEPAYDLHNPVSPEEYPSPKYPADWSYTSYVMVRGNTPGSYRDENDNPIGDGTGYAMIPPNKLPNKPADPPGQVEHRVTDLLISVPPMGPGDTQYFAWPLWAMNDDPLIHTDEPNPGEFAPPGGDADSGYGLIWDFTGRRALHDKNIKLQAYVPTGLPAPELLYAAGVPESYRAQPGKGSAGLWLPPFNQQEFSGIVPRPYYAVHPGGLYSSTPPHYVFTLNQSHYNSVSMLDFFFRFPGGASSLYAARLDMPRGGTVPSDWYRRIKPFSFEIHDATLQKSGVTILNNVIDPTRNQRTYIDYTLNKSGRVTIQVFTLDGSLVQVLQRGSQSAGNYRVSWDGRNRGGNAVARGMYFVRVVGPEIDELRKVMVVK